MSRELAVALTPEQWGMVSSHRELVDVALLKLAGKGVKAQSAKWLDAEQTAMDALERAAAKHSPDHCPPFEAYAAAAIRNALIDMAIGIRRLATRRCVPLDYCSEPLSSIQEPVDILALNDARANVRRIVGLLPSRERAVLRMYFGLDGDPPMPCREIGPMLGLSKSGAEGILRRGLLFVKGVLLA